MTEKKNAPRTAAAESRTPKTPRTRTEQPAETAPAPKPASAGKKQTPALKPGAPAAAKREPETGGPTRGPKPPAKPATKPAAAARPAAAKKGAARTRAAQGTKQAKPADTGRPAAGHKPAAAGKAAQKQAALSILMVASEAHPFATTGGLAEVAGSLPLALAKLGHTVTLVVPRYRGVTVEGAGEAATLRFGDRHQPVTFYTREVAPGVRTVLIDAPALFDREGLYGSGQQEYGDNAWRFAVLGLGALEYARQRGLRPSVIHAHDWQAGLVPVFQKMRYSADPVVGGVPVVFTIHNVAFQGVFPQDVVATLGLPPDVLHVDAMEFWGQVSYLKAGINFSERITTVSPTYARELLGGESAHGFEGVLRRRQEDFTGILNGIDVERWNPAADPYVPARYSAEDLAGKREAKRALLEASGLPVTDATLARPLVGLVTRLTHQKGCDLVAAAAPDLMALDATWVMHGSGEAQYEALWRTMAEAHPDRVATTIGFEERLLHLIEAGADIFLMPSRYEPCGLNQLYSLRYGTVPVVRATGGLADTVKDARQPGGTGFTFQALAPDAMLQALREALDAYRDHSRWQAIQQAGMREDHSWDASAREYVKVYGQA